MHLANRAYYLPVTPIALHTVCETLAYAIGFRTFLWTRRRFAPDAFQHKDEVAWIAVSAIVGAALGAKLSYWLDDPFNAFGNFPDMRNLLQGKSIIGALLGGLLSVELCKKIVGIKQSTGDAFVLPLTVGMCIGRIGCYLAGLQDHTYGNATSLPWGVDFGDGIARHPTQIYEILFLLGQYAWIHGRRQDFTHQGDRFKAFMIGYLGFRLLVEFIKPVFFAYPWHLSGLQWLCIAGLLYYHRDIPRIAHLLLKRNPRAWEPR